MLHVSQLKVLLEKNDFDSFVRIVRNHFQGKDKSDVSSSTKVINLISVHLYYNQCSKDVIAILIELVVLALNSLSESTSQIDKTQAEKTLQHIGHIFEKGLFGGDYVDLALNFTSQITKFFTTVRDLNCAPENCDIIFQIFCRGSIKTNSVENSANILASAISLYVHGANFSKSKSDASKKFLSSKVTDIVGVIKNKINNGKLSVEDQRKIGGKIISEFETLHSKDVLTTYSYTDIISLHVYMFETSCLNVLKRKEKVSECMPKISSDLQTCWRILDQIDDDSLSRHLTDIEYMIFTCYNLAVKINFADEDELKFAKDMISKCLQIDQKLHQICPESNFKTLKMDPVFSLMYSIQLSLKEFKNAMLTLVDCLVATSPVTGHLATVQKFVQAKRKAAAADDPSKTVILIQLFKDKCKSVTSKSLLNLAKLELICYRTYPEFKNDRKLLSGWIKKVVKPTSADMAMALIEESCLSYFEDGSSGDNMKRCTEALSILNNLEKESRPKSFAVYKSLAHFWTFVHTWKGLAVKLKEDIGKHQKVMENKNQQQNENNEEVIDMGDIRPFDSSLNWIEENKNVEHLTTALECLETNCPSREVLLSDNWIASEQNLLSLISCIASFLALSRREEAYGKALRVWLRLSIDLKCVENRYSALHKILAFFGKKDLFKDEILSALKESSSNSPEIPKIHNLKLLLGYAWSFYYNGNFESALRICGTILSQREVNRNHEVNCLLAAEFYFLVALCRQSAKSYQMSANSVQLPDFCGGFRDIAIYGPIDFGQSALSKIGDSTKLQKSGSNDLSAILLEAQTLSLSFDVNQMMTQLHIWAGLAKYMYFYGKCLLETATSTAFTLRISEGLLMMGEIDLICDKPLACQIKLHEIDQILKGVVCLKTRPVPGKKLTKVRYLDPDKNDIASSPALVRREVDFPDWFLSHKSGCCCDPCSNPILVKFVVNFATLQAVVYSMLSDMSASSSLFQKLSETSKDLLVRTKDLDSYGIERSTSIRLSYYDLYSWEIEVFGQLLNFETCLDLLKDQKQILESFHPTFLRRYPAIRAGHLELKLNVESSIEDRKQFENTNLKPSPLPLNHCFDKSTFLTPDVTQSRNSNMPKRPIKKLHIPPSVEANINALSLLQIEDKEEEADTIESTPPTARKGAKSKSTTKPSKPTEKPSKPTEKPSKPAVVPRATKITTSKAVKATKENQNDTDENNKPAPVKRTTSRIRKL